ncbi:MAG: SPFH domain-containing protein [Actinobacteria bacterium]|nr:SPFH domain-containing protein [Actinomycetota bacterium]NBY14796.1 SPFH domain-containing protein [Actinomycetota bacterium]
MGLIKSTVSSIGGTLSDQWKDFLTVPQGISSTAALFPAVRSGTNSGRGSNTQASQAVITNGSQIVVPEGYGLLLFQEGELTAVTTEPGGYTWNTEDINSQSIFAGNSASSSLIKQSWERFKFGGRPGSQQLAIFVSLKELPNNKFGTQSEIYWDDAYFNAQVGALTHGTYSMTIVDPVTFVKQFVPANYLQAQDVFDFTDISNAPANQLFAEVVGSLSAAFSLYSNDSGRENRITKIQQDSIGFAKSLSQAVEDAYAWRSTRGLEISKVTIVGIEYDSDTKELLKTVQRADALSGSRGSANLQASVAEGIQSAGQQGGSDGILGIGLAAGSIGVGALMQTGTPTTTTPNQNEQDLVANLEKLKRALESGLITQEDYDAAKAKALGLA